MKHRRLTIAAIAGAVLFVGLGAGLVELRSDASWQEMRASAAAISARLAAEVHEREPIWGTPTPERASEHYERAMELEAALPESAADAIQAAIRGGDDAVHATAADRERWQPILEALRRGTHATDTSALVTLDIEAHDYAPSLRSCRRIAWAAILESRRLRNDGRHRAAVQWTLDVATFGNDLGRRGTLIQQLVGCALTAIGTGEAWSPEALAALDDDALDELAAGLARLDERMPLTATLDHDLVLLAHCLEQPFDDSLDAGSSLTAWRYGFSTRWMLADAFHQTRALWDRMARIDARWPVREARLERAFAAVQNSHNPVIQVFCPTMVGAELQLRMSLTGVRMLRVAVDLQRGRPPLPLEDPLGDARLTIEETAQGHLVRSAGERHGKPIERRVLARP